MPRSSFQAHASKQSRLVGLGVLVGSLLYVGTIAAVTALRPDYSSAHQLISELGITGAPYGAWLRSMLAVEGLLICALAWALYRSVAGVTRWGPALMLCVSGALLAGAVFPCDAPHCAPETCAGWTHILTGGVATLAALSVPFVFVPALRRNPTWRRYAGLSQLLGCVSLVAFFFGLFAFPAWDAPGIGQRITTGVQMAWFVMMAIGLLRPDTFPPGPSGLRALRLLGFRRDLLRFTAHCTTEYGGFCGIRLPGVRAFLISDPALIHQVFVKNADKLKQWDLGHFERVLGQGLLTSSGELWRRQRRLIQPVFQPKRMQGYTEEIVAASEKLARSWPAEQELDVHQAMLRLSLQVAAASLFGADSSRIERVLSECQELLMDQFEDAMQGIPIPLSLPTPKNKKTLRAIEQLEAAVMELIRDRRADQSRDFLSAMCGARDDDGTGMTDKQLRDECVTMILAGHETTGLVLTWTLHLLAKHPEVAAEVREELKRTPATEAPLLRAVLQESMRLYPPVWAIGRVTTEAMKLGEYPVPKGSQLFLLPFYTHRDPSFFPDPAAFRPKRWLAPDIKSLPKCAYLPFGAGPRKCVGMHFAVHENLLILGMLLKEASFETLDRTEPALQASVTLRPRGGMPLRVKRLGDGLAQRSG